jgi:hypothetical protein
MLSVLIIKYTLNLAFFQNILSVFTDEFEIPKKLFLLFTSFTIYLLPIVNYSQIFL